VTNLVEKAQDRALTVVKQAQDAALGAVSTVTGLVSPLVERIPSLPLADRVPAPTQFIKNAYGFADKLLDTQKKYALELADTLSPLTEKVASRTARKSPAKTKTNGS
jgi:hypothetical protein